MKKIGLALLLLLSLALAACSGPQSSGTAAPQAQSAYIQNKGSDTMVNLALAWAERYQNLHPDVRISVTGGGSGTGISSLINGTVDLANASRQIKEEEVHNAEANGIEPTEHIVARDAIAVIVHPENPVQALSLQQIADIYTGKINNWSEVGGVDRPIVRVSRETNSGTHVYFLEAVIRLGRSDLKDIFSPDTLLLPSSEGIISEVSQNPNAIGYDGLGYVTPHVKVLAVSKEPAGAAVLPSVETTNDGTYPISRDLYIYSGTNLKPEVQAYLDWMYSPEAQGIVQELGFVPIQNQGETTRVEP